jgi:hypothetical protein
LILTGDPVPCGDGTHHDRGNPQHKMLPLTHPAELADAIAAARVPSP